MTKAWQEQLLLPVNSVVHGRHEKTLWKEMCLAFKSRGKLPERNDSGLGGGFNLPYGFYRRTSNDIIIK